MWIGNHLGEVHVLDEIFSTNQKYSRVPTRTGKMGRHSPVRENSGNIEQTAKVRENHTNYWKSYILFFIDI